MNILQKVRVSLLQFNLKEELNPGEFQINPRIRISGREKTGSLRMTIDTEELPFSLDIEIEGAFIFDNELEVNSKEQIKVVVTQLWPYLVENVFSITGKGGLVPISLPPFDMEQLETKNND